MIEMSEAIQLIIAIYENEKEIVYIEYKCECPDNINDSCITENDVVNTNGVIEETKETYEVVTHKGIYASPIPLAEYNVQNRLVKTFYNYSIITDLEGNEVVRNVQIHVRGEKIYIFDANDSSI